jgi:hypothetical protein
VKPARLQLDFHAPPFARQRLAGYVILVLSLLALMGVVRLKSSLDDSLTEARAGYDRAARLGATDQARGARRPAAHDERIVRASAVLDALYLPWDDLFAMIEGAGSGGLGLLSVVPDAASHTVQITGQAKDLSDVLSYLGRLSRQPALEKVHLVSFSSVEREGVAAVEFSIGANWKSP